ncbi:uncharacterized protein LOC122362727 [Puntigrus tetrazona]|uniref:uncharacterized protein LOC122362727 n=1 Tax=Puntigrus tetrazona TaxID=1606681 RepID=UPI001C8AB8A3|nr:uncharacterized protein LOC122362727 [Puntigrus tetrazona]
MEQEVESLLRKEAIEVVPPHAVESGFYSRYFIVPKKDGGLRPIIDRRVLNRSVNRLKINMLTIKHVVTQIRSEDWFVNIDLKDAYFHLSILPQHRKFLRFAFGGVAYQYRVLLFGLALSPRTFTKCMDAALAPLRLQGIRILNYIDDWGATSWTSTRTHSSCLFDTPAAFWPRGRRSTKTHSSCLFDTPCSLLACSGNSVNEVVDRYQEAHKQAHFLPDLRGHHVLLHSDNTAVVSYINHQGGLCSRLLERAHSTRGMSASKAYLSGVPLRDICNAAGWSTPSTFTRFYNLDMRAAPGSSVLS